MTLQTDLLAAQAKLSADTQAVAEIEAKIAAAAPHQTLWERVTTATASLDANIKSEIDAIVANAYKLLDIDAPATPTT